MNEENKSNDERLFFITTTDNPYNYFDNFEEWYNYDHYHGYYTLEYLDRVAQYGKNLGEIDDEETMNEAIEEIIKLQPWLYQKCYAD